MFVLTKTVKYSGVHTKTNPNQSALSGTLCNRVFYFSFVSLSSHI